MHNWDLVLWVMKEQPLSNNIFLWGCIYYQENNNKSNVLQIPSSEKNIVFVDIKIIYL